MKYDIFISYSRKDAKFAEKVCEILERYRHHYKFAYFFDREDITSYQDYLVRISEAISESRCMLFLASKHSLKSEFCVKELLFADEERLHIHQYRLDFSTYPKPIKLLLGNHHYRQVSEFSIEDMIREVLSDVLRCDIKPLSTFTTSSHKVEKKSAANYNKFSHTLKRFCIGIIVIVSLLAILTTIYVKITSIAHENEFNMAQELADTEGIYQPGVYYNKDGKEGVVFWVDETGRHGKIVSLDQAWSSWCEENAIVMIGASSKTDGQMNTQKVLEYNNLIDFPAFYWCQNKGRDWYLPSIDELTLLLLNDDVRDAVNRCLRKHNAKELLDRDTLQYYLSSTEDKDGGMMIIDTYNGVLGGYYKRQSGFIRAVAKF